MRHSPFVNSSTESNYVFLVLDYIDPLWKLNWNTHLFSGDNTQLYVEVKKTHPAIDPKYNTKTTPKNILLT